MLPIHTTNYAVFFNNDCYNYLKQIMLPDNYSKVFIIVDVNTGNVCLPNFLAQLVTEVPIEIIEIEAGEENKNITTCIEVWNALTELGGDRKSLVINVGGGVVTDLGGFIASTFKRGIDFINVPTTLLSMVDASIGGKTGIDLDNIKNQIGVINNPVSVLIDTQFLEILPQNQMRSGLAEMLKHGLISDKKYWESFLDLSNLTTDDLGALIHKSVQIKNSIVEKDPKEKNIRKALNFGHTLGHAIESYFLTNKEKNILLHGEAIAIGIILESYISLKKELITETEYIEIKTTILNIFNKVEFASNDVSNIIELLVHDKKNEFGIVQFVLLNGIGSVKINQEVENTLIFKAFEDYLD